MEAGRNRIGIVASVAAIALLLLAALTIAILPGQIEDDLAAQAAAALKAAHGDHVTATISGRHVTLTGQASDDNQKAAAVAAVEALPAVASVDDQIVSPGPPPKPSTYKFVAAWDGRKMALSGYMPSRDQREEIATHTRDTLPGATIANGLEVAPGAPDANWPRIAEAGIAAMKPLRSATLTMTGPQIVFSGVADSDAARAAATDILDRLPTPYEAKIDIAVGAPTTPAPAGVPTSTPSGPGYPFGVAYDGAGLALSGSVPSAGTRASLLAALKQALPQIAVGDHTVIDPNAPDGGWADATALILAQLKQMSAATLSANGRVWVLSALVKTAAAKGAVLKALGALPVAYQLTADIAVENAGKADSQTIGGPGSPAYECQMAYDAALRKSAIAFASSSAALPPSAAAMIAQLAQIAGTCPTATVEITGHTDASGKPADNQKLSQQRADAVEAAMIAKGVAAKRLSSRGFGSDRPVAANTTDQGKAQNRRIEVIVRP